jgi:site-specific DNA-cytosine methylase
LQKISGIVLKTEVKKEYSKNYEVMIDRKRLFLVGYDESYIFNKSKDFELFQKFLSKDDSVTIWKNTKNYPYTIEQFSKGDTMILEYKRIDIAGLVFAGFGLIALIISILYIFKHPEDLKGEEETE